MRYHLHTLFFGIALFIAVNGFSQHATQLTDYVNPFIGTGGHGHTYPGATRPFGMVQLSPDTRLEGWDGCSGYHFTDTVIYGFSHTHLSGTGVSDYGDVLIMPTQGKIIFDNGAKTNGKNGYASAFKKNNEVAKPGYYQVALNQHQINVRLTTTPRVGIHEYTFNNAGPSNIILDLAHRDLLLNDSISIVGKQEVVGHRISKAWATEQHLYFVMQFSKEFKQHEMASNHEKAAFVFDTKPNEKITVKVGISAVSIDGARKNLVTEAKHWNFDEYVKDAQAVWEKALSKIQITDNRTSEKTIFYSALYHSLIAPNVFSDVDGKYRGMDRKVHTSKHPIYTVFSLWDTFRATHPLFTIIEQEKTNEFIQTFLTQYNDGGELPIWELAGNYTGCMIGYHSIPVIADAYMKGIRDFDQEAALKAMMNSAEQDKLGLKAYKNKGYIAVADESESVSKTLEYAYDDWCIAQMAKEMDQQLTYDKYISRGQYFKNIFNPEVGFMQSKMNGGWSTGFDPAEVNFNFTEANSWQYSMFTPQDISGLIDLYGGPSLFEKKLDQLFTTEMKLSGRHQADITGLIGQYAHGNEPSHHMAYLYNYIGKPHKTQQRVNQILNEQYSNKADGLSGNEDCGQMSSWYVLSSMGFYSVTPGLTYYTIGTPLFQEATLNLENGKSFTIKANNRTDENYYIQSATLNGKPLNRSYILHNEITNGGTIIFEMGHQPNEAWGSKEVPTSKIVEKDRIVPVPYFNTSAQTFTDSLEIEIKALDNSTIFYSLNNADFLPYKHPFVITNDANISTYAQRGNKKSFMVKDVNYKKIKGGRSIQLDSKYSNQYSAGGDDGLINYLKGGTDFRTGYWQGYYETDFSAVVDLGNIEPINRVALGALQDIKSWIWFPKQVTVSISTDGIKYEEMGNVINAFPDSTYGGFNQEFKIDTPKNTKARYVKVEAKNYGKCPEWHLGNGNPTWLFFDEITIE